MVSMSKALMDESILGVAAHTHDAWVNKAVWTRGVILMLFDDVKVDVVKIFFCLFLERLWPLESWKVHDEISS